MIQRSKAIAMNILSPMPRLVMWEKRALLRALQGPAQPLLQTLKDLSFIHFARWVVIPRDAFPRPGAARTGQPEEALSHDYLLFCSNFNGAWDQYLDAFSDVLDSGLNLVWGGCLNWPDAAQVTSLKRYVRWHQIRPGVSPTHYYYCAYPQATTSDVKAALHLHDVLAELERSTAGLGPTGFAAAYASWLGSVQLDLASLGPAPVDADTFAAQQGYLDLATPPPFGNPLRLSDYARRQVKSGLPPTPPTASPRAANRWGQAYGLTALSPILPGQEQRLAEVLEALPNGSASPFARSASTHLARWVVLDRLPDQGLEFPLDRLRSKYLLFESNFDGGVTPLDAYLGELATAGEIDAIYRHCMGYAGPGAFVEYVRQCQLETTFFYSDYADTERGTVANVLRALEAKRLFLAFVRGGKNPPPPSQPPPFQQLLAQLRAFRPQPGA